MSIPLLGAGLSGPAAGGITRTFLNTASDTATKAIYTFASLSFGDAAANRYLEIHVHVRGNGGSPRTCEVLDASDNVLATATELINDGSGQRTSIYLAAVPTETTGKIRVTLTNTAARCHIAWARLVGINATPHATAAAPTTTDNPISLTLDVPANGVVVAAFTSTTTTGSVTWANITEEYDFVSEILVSGGAQSYVSAQTSLVITGTDSATPSEISGVAASFAPA